jgi:hypothetical protein
MPNPAMMQPEMRLSHGIHLELNFVRSRLMPPVRMHHHRAEPQNTPAATSVAVR